MKIFKTIALGMFLTVSAGAYAQSVTVVMKDGTQKKFAADRIGEMTFEQKSDPSALNCTFDNVDVSVYSGGNFAVKLTESTTGVSVVLDLYGEYSATYLAPGHYVGGATSGLRMDYRYSNAVIDGKEVKVAEGNVDVALDGEVYTITPDVKLENGTTLKGSFTGELNAGGPSMKLTMSAASYLSNPQRPGEFYVKLNDSAWNCEMAIDFQGETADKTLQPGKYTFSNGTASPMTFSEKSYLDTYNPSSSNRFADGSTVDVSLDGETYTLVMKLICQDGRVMNVNYTGPITGTPTFEE